MRMDRLQEFTPVFTEELPYKKDMEFGKIYISREHKVACFLCPCGCGEVHHISFMKGLRNQWVFTEDKGKVTFRPSIGCFESPYKSHWSAWRRRGQRWATGLWKMTTVTGM